jgi:osmotically-inducible protein OsmY
MMRRAPTLLLIAALGLGLSACVTNRSFGDTVDDSAVDLSLKRELFADTAYDYSDVDIAVFEGRLLLTGTVRSIDARRELGFKAASLGRAEEILNEVVVGGRTSIGQGTRDALIDQRLTAALVADNGVFSNNYQVIVSNGTVYLLGIAQGPEELARVTGHARTVDGVRDVVSHVVFVRDPRRGR